MNYWDDLCRLLQTAVGDGGSGAFERIAALARSSDELECTFTTYVALAAWGEPGLRKILQTAIDGSTVKSKSVALTLFALLEKHGQFPEDGSIFVPPSIAKMANERVEPGTIKTDAKHALHDLIIALPTDDLLIPLSQSFTHFSFVSEDATKELVSAAATKWLRFGLTTLQSYERMLTEQQDDEPAFQKFFCSYPQLLDPMAVQVWSQPNFHGRLEPDFIVRRADDSYLVIEIETPGKRLLTSAPQLSQAAIHAETQVLEYEHFLSERIAEARMHFPNYQRADCLAVVGLESALDSKQKSHLDQANRRKQNLRVVGFDWLLDRARTVINNVSAGDIEVVARHRLF